MSKTYVRKFPVNHMRNVVKAAREANEKWIALNPEREKLPTTNIEMDAIIRQYGDAGKKRIDEARADLKIKEAAIKAALDAIVEHERAAYMEEVNSMFEIRPEQLDGKNALEFQLLQLGLLETPESVRDFISRNCENPTLIKLACRYAETQSAKMDNAHDRRVWFDISAENTTESDLLSFESWFTDIGKGCASSPDGYCFLMTVRPNMELDTMQDFGLLEEYGLATGVATDPISVFYALSGSENGTEENSGNSQEDTEQTENMQN